MVNAYEAAVAWVNDTALAVAFTNAVVVVVRMSLLGNHRQGPFVNRISDNSLFPLWDKENNSLTRVSR